MSANDENVLREHQQNEDQDGYPAYATVLEEAADGSEHILGILRGRSTRDPKGTEGKSLFVPDDCVYTRGLDHIRGQVFNVSRKMLMPTDAVPGTRRFIDWAEVRLGNEAYQAVFDAIPEEDRLARRGLAKHMLNPRGSIWFTIPPRSAMDVQRRADEARRPLAEMQAEVQEQNREATYSHLPPDQDFDVSNSGMVRARTTSHRYQMPEAPQVAPIATLLSRHGLQSLR